MSCGFWTSRAGRFWRAGKSGSSDRNKGRCKMSISLTITEQVEINRLQSCLLDTAQMVDVQRFHAVLSSLRKLIGAARGFGYLNSKHRFAKRQNLQVVNE
jgi:hypothetical protein